MTNYFKTNHSKMVFDDRYAMKNENGEQLETSPVEMWDRVSTAVASVENPDKQHEVAGQFYHALEDFKFVPGGRILAGMGTGADVTAYNCFVIPSPEDSYDGIFENIHRMGQIMRRGGGVGIDLSTLRPKNAYVTGTNGYSSGPVAFAEIYSQTTNITSQGGSRRGALMLMLSDNHPDIFEFINVKADLSRITGANLSVKISDRLMDAVKNDKGWALEWGGEPYEMVRARDLWEAITTAAHRSAEPGLWFSERSNKEANSWYFEELIATNPCGEQPLGEWGVCNLGAINLSRFVQDGNVKWDELQKTVATAVRFLDNIIDLTNYHFKENEKAQKSIRRVGLGTMGLADMLIYLGIPYGSPKAVEFTNDLYEVITNTAYKTSAELSKEKGCFPRYDTLQYLQGKFVKGLAAETEHMIQKHGIRNCYVMTQAPTGSTGSLAQVAGTGIEPVFEYEFRRSDRLGEHIVREPIADELIEAGAIPADRSEWPDYMTTAQELTPKQHVDMQAAIQRWNDSAVSKTVNAPKTYTPEDVAELYEYAYDNGLKGITVYVDGSRTGVLNYVEDEEEDETPAPANEFTKRPQVLRGNTIKTQTPFGKAYVTINENEADEIEEVFVKLGKTGADISAISDGLAIALTGVLSPRLSGLTPDEKVRWIIKKFRGMSGENAQGFGPNKVESLPDAVAKTLQMHLESQESANEEYDTNPQPKASGGADADLCPNCGAAALVREEGCENCKACGFAKC